MARRSVALDLMRKVLTRLAGVGEEAPAIQVSRVTRTSLVPSGIPAGWVMQGAPEARIKGLAQAEDGGVSAALWDCTAGTFEWQFGADELVHILEGEVEVQSEDGTQRVLKVGDVAYFSAGTKSIWNVPVYVKKLAVLRDNREPLARRISRKLTSLFGRRERS